MDSAMSASTTQARAVRAVGACLCHIVFAILFVAAVAKFIDLTAFAASLRTWTLLPETARLPIALAVPMLELGVALAWYLRLGIIGPICIAFGSLMVFTTAYLCHLVFAEAPSCECLGMLAAHDVGERRATAVVARNSGLMAALFVGGVLLAPGVAAERRAWGPSRSLARAARGFTLIETLAVIVIVALVIALVLPALAGVRARTQNVKSLVHLRSHVTTMATYTADAADLFPYLTDPKATLTVLRGGGEVASIPYFMLFATWNVGLADEYYNGNARHESFAPPWGSQPLPHTLYFYGDVFISRPDYWKYETRRTDGSQLRPTLAPEVAFPSHKGLIYEMGWLSHQTPSRDPGASHVRFGLVDGSAGEFRQEDLRPAYIYGSQVPGQSPQTGWSSALPVMGTIEGVYGRDVK